MLSRPCPLLSLRPVYVSAVRPQSKHLVIMVDHGALVTDTQLQIARDSALVILNAVDEHDKVRLRSDTLTGPVSPSLLSEPLTGLTAYWSSPLTGLTPYCSNPLTSWGAIF